MKLFPKSRNDFQPTVRHHSVLKHAADSATIPKRWILPRIEFPILGMATAGLFGLGLLLYFFAADKNPVLGTINTILFWLTVASVVTAGDNGRRLVHWLGFKSLTLRKAGIKADQRPISRRITRVIFYSVLALDLGTLIWWWVFTSAPLPDRNLYTDRLLWEVAKLSHLTFQLTLYWWLLPVLVILFAGFLGFMEHVPVIGWNLRRSRFTIPLAPLLACLEARMILDWIYQTTGWSLF